MTHQEGHRVIALERFHFELLYVRVDGTELVHDGLCLATTCGRVILGVGPPIPLETDVMRLVRVGQSPDDIRIRPCVDTAAYAYSIKLRSQDIRVFSALLSLDFVSDSDSHVSLQD